MGTALVDLTIEEPNDSLNNFLHNYGTTFSTGSQISLGSGTDTGLVLWNNAIGVHNGTARLKFVSLANADRIVTFPNKTGTAVLGDGEGITDAKAFNAALGETVVKLGADEANSTTTLAAVPSFSFTPAVSTFYEFKIYLKVQTAAAATGLDIRLKGPTANFVQYRATVPMREDGDDHLWEESCNAFDEAIAPTDLEDTNSVLMKIEGIMEFGAGPLGSDISLEFASETASTEVKILAGSMMVFKAR